jgi:ribosome assembly protein RRB1
MIANYFVCTDDDDNSDDDDDDDDLDDDPVIEDISVPHMGGVNRIRSMPQMPGVIATMADTKFTHIYDMSIATRALMSPNTPHVKPNEKPVFTFKGHKDEGFALDWSPATLGK